jgi:hypothetical protein
VNLPVYDIYTVTVAKIRTDTECVERQCFSGNH